ncbi:MAG: S1-C subfamily serine protease [Dinoroseobacter sp.]|jgi:S1-C subfamily serine protease
MVRFLYLLVGLVFLAAAPVAAQERVWVQVEANATLAEAEAAVRRYAAVTNDVNGVRLRSGWYAVALGPFAPNAGIAELQRLLRAGLVPRDSYLADGTDYIGQFWPIGANTLAASPVTPGQNVTEGQDDVTQVQALPPVVVVVEPPVPSEETRAEALQTERLLDRPAREDLQIAMQWFGFYRSGIDGAFGPGTRNAMAEWQSAQNYEANGVLSTKQRVELLGSYQAELDSVGLAVVRDDAAGIEMQLPLARVAFSLFEPPFVQYNNTDGSGVRVLLISQEGTRATLHGLYDIMQTLEIVPLEGAREKRSNDFTLTGQSDDLHSYTYARLNDGLVKGFTVTWAPEEAELMNKIARFMQDSFTPVGTSALDETLGQPSVDQRIDLMAGLEVRQPVRSRSGFFVDARGTILTTTEAVDQCSRVTLGASSTLEADVIGSDEALGLAVLRPRSAQAPINYAAFLDGIPRLRSEIAVAGFSFEGALGAPTLSFGTLEDLRGLAGEAQLTRLAVAVQAGDSGGPVLDASGKVLGLLLPTGANKARALPEGVNFAANADAISGLLSTAGVSVRRELASGVVDPADLTALAADMTVLVSCWE